MRNSGRNGGQRDGGQRGGGRGGGRGRGRGRGGNRSRRGGGGNGRRRDGRDGGRGRGGGGRGRDRDLRAASKSGNKRERISIESGHLVLIDQFMLANPQFIDRVLEVIDEDPSSKDTIIQDFGGTVVELEPGTYRIQRDPFALTIVIHGDETDVEASDAVEAAKAESGRVFVDTRCLAMVDRELLDDNVLLEKYKDLWFDGDEKGCRDLLRDNGGAVRYGFRRYGDELGVYCTDGEPIVCLWPDVAEPDESQTAEAEGEEASPDA